MTEATHVTRGAVAGVGVKPMPGRVRTCVGCGERVSLAHELEHDMVRLVLGAGGEVSVDEKGGSGRGAHVHARRSCVERAAPGGLLRATKGRARAVVEPRTGASQPLAAAALVQAIAAVMDRRVEKLLRAAHRSRQLSVFCSPASTTTGEAPLLVVACDAPSAAEAPEVRTAIAEGRAVAWGNKQALGDIQHPSQNGVPSRGPAKDAEVDAIAVSSARVGAAVRRAVRAANAVSTVGPAVGKATNGRGGRGRAARRLAGSAPERRTAE
jgi:predicted RNA-binding protein YlxR (DUF448 family)